MKTVILLSFVAFALLMGGCGDSEPELTPVRGKVYFQGNPLRSGVIVFTPNPDRGGTGPLATATIQSDGTYVLRSGDRPGAVAGWHRVSVLSPLSPKSKEAPLPRKYSDPALSGQNGNVKPGAENTIDFHLK